MYSLSVVVTLALLPFASAQVNFPQDLAAIKAHFTQSRIVPELLESFDPTALLSLNYAGVGDVTPGQALTKDQVGPIPTITLTTASGSKLDGNYTLAMVDADAVGSDLSKGVTRHWLVNGLSVEGTGLNNASSVAITTYAGPAPPAGSGPHRYAILLYTQPATFAAPVEFSQPDMGVSLFDVNAYAKDAGLGPIVAGTYITVAEGEATGSIAPTSAVVTSTLSVQSAAGSAAGSAKPTGSATGSGKAPASSGSTTPNGASSIAASPLLGLAGLVMMIVA